MKTAIEKYARLVDTLYEKTIEDKIPWSYSSDSKVVYVWGDDTLLNISVGNDDNFESVYSVSLYNRQGIVLDSFNDVHLHEQDAGSGFKSYYLKMEDLYDLAKKRATGADKALDNFMKILEQDGLDLPF